MPVWGADFSDNDNFVPRNSQSWMFASTGISPDVANAKLASVDVMLPAGVTGRVALYSGGASAASPGEAVLIADLGIITNTTGGDAAVSAWANGQDLPRNTRLWLAFKAQNSTYYCGNIADGGFEDQITSHAAWWSDDSVPTVPWPQSLSALGTPNYTGSVNAVATARVSYTVGSAVPSTLSNATHSNITGTTATLTVSASLAGGTLFMVTDSNPATEPSAAQIKAARDASGVAAEKSGNVVAVAGSNTFNLTGLTPDTTYCYALIQNNGVDSNVVSGAFKTAPANGITVNDGSGVTEGAGLTFKATGVSLTGATAAYLRHGTRRVNQSSLVVLNSTNATAGYVLAIDNVGVPFTSLRHTVQAGVTVGANDYEIVVNHKPTTGLVGTLNPATMSSTDGSLFKNLISWFATQTLTISANDQVVLPTLIGAQAVTWSLDNNGNVAGFIASGPSTGSGSARYWLASNQSWYEIPFTLTDGSIDTLAPSLVVGPTISEIDLSSALLTGTPNESGLYGIALLPSTAATPVAGNILAGTVSGAVWSRSSTAMTANMPFSALMEGVAGASYRAHIALRDAAGNSRVVSSATFTLLAGDTSPPDLSEGPTITNVAQASANLTATPTESGTYGIVLLPAVAVAPGAGAILTRSVAGAVWSRGSTPMTADVPFSALMTGTTGGNSYRAHIALQDEVGNARVVSSSAFTTLAGTDTRAPQFIGSIGIANLHPDALAVTFTSDEDGQYRVVLLPSGATTPSVLDVFNGTGSGGEPVVAVSVVSSMSVGMQVNVAFTGLPVASSVVPYVVLRDNAGNLRLGTAGVVNLPTLPDETAPTIALTAAKSGDQWLLTADVADNVGVVGVQFLLDGEPMGAELIRAPWQRSWNSASYPEGNYTVTARARDLAGNTTLSNAVLLQVDQMELPPGAPFARRGRGLFEQRDETWYQIGDDAS